ncbi:MAG: LCP family protein, partial [Clostridia bacterium]|nr:LCP family protein [Clostridia bacterium]
ILGAILLIILGLVLFFYFKMKNMSRNAPPTIPTAIVLPNVTAAPADLVDVDDPGYITIPDDRKATDLTEEEQAIIDNFPNDPDYEPFDPGIMEPGDDPIYYVPRISGDVLNILILGNDAKADERDHGRTDVMHILSYNKATRKAKLVAIIRDTYIYIPGRDKWNRINTAFRFGGVGLAMNTLNVNFGLDIQYYVRVDFTTMPQLINAIGGIDIDLSVAEISYINAAITSSHIPRVSGVHHLNGYQALRHARNRAVGNHVWARANRHNQILNAVLEKMKQQENPVALMAMMYQLVDKLDTNIPVESMVSMAVDVVFGGSISMNSRLLPFEGTWKYAMERGMAVIKIDIPANKAKLLEYLYGK